MNEKTKFTKMYNDICRALAGIEPNSEAIPLVHPIGTPAQQALLKYLSLTIVNSDFPSDERRKIVFDNMSATEYLQLSNVAEVNGKCNDLSMKINETR